MSLFLSELVRQAFEPAVIAGALGVALFFALLPILRDLLLGAIFRNLPR